MFLETKTLKQLIYKTIDCLNLQLQKFTRNLIFPLTIHQFPYFSLIAVKHSEKH